MNHLTRARWAAFGAAVAVTLGLAGIGTVRFVQAQTANDGGSVFVPLTPARILDTRQGVGGVTGPIVSGGTFELQVAGAGGVPADATGVVLNVTSTQTTAAGYATIWPAGEPQPETSNLNLTAGQDLPNLVTVKLGTGGRISFFNFGGPAQLLADVAGYYVGHDHDDRYYTKAEVDSMLAQYLTTATADSDYVEKADIGNTGVMRWAKIRGNPAEVYRENELAGFAPMTATRTGAGEYDVIVPGITANGGYYSIFVTADQPMNGQPRTCKLFQNTSLGDAADTLVAKIRCYGAGVVGEDTDFSILVLH